MEILELRDVKTVPDIIHEYSTEIKNELTPLIIDNGMYRIKQFFTQLFLFL